jgi:hypothetical protein
VAAATDAVGVVMQDAMSAFEAAVSAAGRQARPRPGTQSDGEVWDMATDEPGTPSLVEPARPQAPAPADAPADAPAAEAAAPEAAGDPADPADEVDPAGDPVAPAAESAAPKSADGPAASEAAADPGDEAPAADS